MYNISRLLCENLKSIGVKLMKIWTLVSLVSLTKKISLVYKFLQINLSSFFLDFLICYNILML